MRAGGRILVLLAVLAGLSGGATASAEPVCDNGLRFSMGDGDAAMGLRVVQVQVLNCGPESLQLNGYPQVQLLDEDRRPLTVDILEGSGGISSVEGFDDPPQPITVLPGETAKSAFMWKNRNTGEVEPQLARYADMAAAPGGTWYDLAPRPGSTTLYIDLGTTGRLGVKAWHR
ncbi:DUF4232 domain-containing protein [Lentzea sp. NPDC051213]|uniref:DUF4232 domain-containing protein n=1 Tax=Lentzea sp. NPDC051213 TaxID=3364126 RepID=UPI0037926766